MYKNIIKLITLNLYTVYVNLKSIKKLSLLKTMDKFYQIKTINNQMHMKNTKNLSLVKTIL